MAALVFPPTDGSLTISPGLVDFHAKHNADQPWAIFPSRADPSQLEFITFAELANATHRIAHRIRPQRQGPGAGVVALLLHCDAPLYAATMHGLARAGLVTFPISPRLSPEAIANLLEKTNATRVISQPMLKPLMDKAIAAFRSSEFKVEIIDLWSIYDIFPTLNNGGAKSALEEGPYPERTRPVDPDEPLFILHSSGSTGFPKPVLQTYKIALQWASSNLCQESKKRSLRWLGGHLPTLHAMGYTVQIIIPMACAQGFSCFPPTEPVPPVLPTPDRVLELIRLTKSNGVAVVPSFIESWAQSEEAIKFLSSLEVLGYAGGPLSNSTGVKLVKAGVTVQSTYGSTESGVPSAVFDFDDSQGLTAPWKTSLDFDWMRFPHPVNARFVDQGDGTYEMQFLTCETHQPAAENLKDTRGYATSDLFERHPTKKGLWRIVGRQDDVIVLGTGEKIVPIPQESHIMSSPLLIGAIMFGRGKAQAGVLLELHPSHQIDISDESAVIEFRNKIWPVIEESNALAPTFAKIYKEMILISDPEKPFLRAPKGTFVRKPSLALYTDAIEALYQTVEQSAEAMASSGPASWKFNDVQPWLIEQVAALHEGVSADIHRDLFEQGYDSLSATFLRNRIISALRSSEDDSAKEASRSVSQNFVFDSPTIQQLTEAICALVSPQAVSVQKSRAEHITELITKYAADLPQVQQTQPPQDCVVLLTGSTGNIGSHVLAALLRDQHVAKVYTIDRAMSGMTPKGRLDSAFQQRGLPVELLADAKLSMLVGDLNTEEFGLDKAVFAEIKSSVSHVVHNAWKVDFNHGLGSFEAHISGTRRLIDFCASLSHSASLLFTSSISVAGKWDTSSGPVPESVLDDPEVATVSGYSASKYITEQLLSKASDKGLKTTSLRIGQVTGSASTGAWNTSDWVPIMVKSSIALGAVPELPGVVSWIPIDAVANVVLDLVLSRQPEPRLLNVVHPQPVAWDEIIRLVNDATGKNLSAVPYAEWLAKLEALEQKSASEAQILHKIPALKLLEFFRGFSAQRSGSTEAGGLPPFATVELQKQSETARALSPLGAEHAQAWVRYWKEQAFLV